MDKKVLVILFLVFLFGAGLGFSVLSNKQPDQQNILTEDVSVFHAQPLSKLTYDEYCSKLEKKETFIVDISRISCRYCAITEDLLITISQESGLPIYILDMELYHGRDSYDQIKSELGITYVPTFFYVENGVVKYTMNSPLDDTYFTGDLTPDQKLEMRTATAEKIRAFIAGALGKADPINEELLQEIVVNAPKVEDVKDV